LIQSTRILELKAIKEGNYKNQLAARVKLS